MKYGLLSLFVLVCKLSVAMDIVNDEPKYSTQEYIQSYCILEYCPHHINDKEFTNQTVTSAKRCYESCCDKHGGCPNSISEPTKN